MAGLKVSESNRGKMASNAVFSPDHEVILFCQNQPACLMADRITHYPILHAAMNGVRTHQVPSVFGINISSVPGALVNPEWVNDVHQKTERCRAFPGEKETDVRDGMIIPNGLMQGVGMEWKMNKPRIRSVDRNLFFI